jgi:hypothetical protein
LESNPLELHPLELHPLELHPLELHPLELHPLELHLLELNLFAPLQISSNWFTAPSIAPPAPPSKPSSKVLNMPPYTSCSLGAGPICLGDRP